ncbi:hypothetical protein BVX95_01140 [archaeon D22]|nr:hypothetical protein BVX95_01140 [archaeon D22]
MSSIEWCKKQKKGVRLIEPLEYMSNDYIERAEKDLSSMILLNGHWKIITAYYACYDILTALLSKVGIKSEIHECTIELMKLFEFNEADILFIKELKQKRIDVQYYLKSVDFEDEILVKKFVLKVKKIIDELTRTEIEKIRSSLYGV